MRVEELLRASALRCGARVAIACGRARPSFAELDRKSDRLAGVLAARGIRAGDRVALFMDNSIETVVTAFAVLKAGAILCLADSGLAGEKLARFLVAVRAVALATEARHATTAAGALAEAEGVRLVILAGGDRATATDTCISFEDAVSSLAVARPRPTADASSPAVVFMTGEDAGLIETHAALAAAAEASGISADAPVAASAPIASYAGLIQMLAAIGAGATQVFGTAARRHADQPGGLEGSPAAEALMLHAG
jgi:acyl-CoA synthetase (AMP-forming)/AMP-acid ligase II